MLDFTSLQKALQTLEEIIERYQIESTDSAVRDAVIQRFEYTYELSCKMLKRFLLATAPNAQAIAEMSFQDLIRTANERYLLANDLTAWLQYREKRNLTSHTYDLQVALKVVAIVPQFYQEARHLLQELEKRNPQ